MEQRGKYLFRVVECGQNTYSHQSPIRQQKPIDLYDLMDVELRMIRQKNLEQQHQQHQPTPLTDANNDYVEDDQYPMQRSK